MAFINLLESSRISELISVLLFLLIFLQTILALKLLNNNYPDVPVTGKQKTNFNRLFLLNFLFLVFLFGIIFAELRGLNEISTLIGKPILDLPFQFFIYGLSIIVVLIFQLIILYGLYSLRRELYANFMKKEFDFEKDHPL